MKYADLSKYVRVLWGAARYGWDLEPTYRAWLAGKVVDALTVPDATLEELRAHLVFDYRLEGEEANRFNFWWAHITEKGFDAGNPLSHLLKGKVKV